jgi:4-hydroxy 2-oxovalerate aldolase
MSHQFTVADVRATVGALDAAGVPVIEVTHGDGLAGSSFNYGFSLASETELIEAAAEAVVGAKIACLLLPGVGTAEDMRAAACLGASVMRIATHCTEADISCQHFGFARELGLETVGFLMMSHSTDPPALARQARIMADAGAQCVYVVDSAGALLMRGVRDRVTALVQELGDDAQVGFHGHQNLSLGVANSLVAYEAGARQIDGCLAGLGAGAGNAPTEVLIALFERLEVDTGVDLDAILAASDIVRGYADRLPQIDSGSIVLGYAGIYSSFLLHAERVAERYAVTLHELLVAVGDRRFVGGQEDMIVDVAIELAARGTQVARS